MLSCFIRHNKTNHFLIGLWCATKSGFYTITGDDQLSGCPEKQLQSQTCTKKKVRVTGGLPRWSTTAFRIPAKPSHPRSVLSKLVRGTENCNACSQHWSTEWVQFRLTTPDRVSHNRFRSWTNWAVKFCLIYYIHLTSRQHSFLQGKSFHNQQEAESAFQEFVKSQSMDFYAIGINKLISHWQKCVDCNSFYFFYISYCD